MLPNLNYLIEQVGKDKGIPKDVIIATLEEAILKAAQRSFGIEEDIEAMFNEEQGEVELFQFKTVVSEVNDPQTEITLKEATELDPDVLEGDSIGIKIDTTDFGRIAAQIAKQVIIQRVRAAEREQVYNDYKDRKGDLIAGTVRRIERGNIIVDLGRTEGILLAKEQSPRETYRAHDRVLAYVLDVTTTTKGPQIILSRTDVGLMLKLFEMEVPEIAEGIVQIVSAAREPGSRCKIAVVSRDPDVDPVGACVGMKGTRVQNIVQELRGEKIDIVTYNPDPVRYVCNALAPAVVSQVLIDEEDHVMEITVPDDQLSLAIGKRGQNVRLASQLTGWRIDIQSESKVEKMAEHARELFQRLPGIDADLADTLTRLGFLSLEDLVRADISDLKIIPGLNEEIAEKLIDAASALQEEVAKEREEEKAEEEVKEGKSKVVKPKTQTASEDDRPELMRLKNMDEELMAKLNEAGYYTIADLMEADFDAKDFSEKFDVSMRKTRGVLHSVKQKSEPETDEEGETQPDDEKKSDDGELTAEQVFSKNDAAEEKTSEPEVETEPDSVSDAEENKENQEETPEA